MKSWIETTNTKDIQRGMSVKCKQAPELIVLVSDVEENGNTFSGQVIHEGVINYGVGHYSKGWTQKLFEPFHGRIILEQ